MVYTPTEWENAPSKKTPLDAENLNNLESGVIALHDALDAGELKGDKGDKGEAGTAGAKGAAGVGISTITADMEDGVVTLTITMTDGTTQSPSFELPTEPEA